LSSEPPEESDQRLLAEAIAGDNAPALTVSELSGALKRTIEDRFGLVRVRGEISGFKRHASGHCYLTLKDDRACIDGVIWKGNAGGMRFRPEDGIEVIAIGRLTTYPARSRYQIVIDRLELAGQGALMALLDKRRQALAAEGLFDPARKQLLPFMPRVIGIVTSPTGAVIRDILHRLADRCPAHVLVWPVAVQGEGAAAQVAAAIRGFDSLGENDVVPRPDLLIVARGGGSIEDLWAFNEEVVVRAVADCHIPTISAVGHETDTTLCDFAADMRAPTPTAAAEIAVPVRAELLAAVRDLDGRLGRAARRIHALAGERSAAVTRRLPTAAALLQNARQRLDDGIDRLPRALARRVAEARSELATAGGALRPGLLKDRIARAKLVLDAEVRQLTKARIQIVPAAKERLGRIRLSDAPIRRKISEATAAVDRLWRIATQADPRLPLKRGYAWVERRGTSDVLTTAAAARAAAALTLRFADGEVDATVDGAPVPRRPAAPPPGQPKLL
jgi:exodeoxyribonuclease VII large subunit